MAQLSGAIRVLHVDDDPEVAAVAAEFLEERMDGFTVETATSAAEGLDRLADGGVDCVVSDYDMPGRNGIEFLEAVRESHPGLPFILYTGKGSEEIASDAISAGVTDYLQKDTGAEQYDLLANRIRKAVSRQRAESNYREIFEKATDGIVLHDPDTGAFLDVNRRFCRIVGYSREELLGETVETFSANEHPYTAEEARRRIQAARDGDPQVFEWVAETKDGDRTVIEVHLKHARIGGQDRVLALVRDVSDRKEYERKLTAIHDVADALTRCESVQAVCERTITASEDVLAFDLSVIDIEDDGVLRKTAVSGAVPPENFADMRVDEGISGRTYRTGESLLVEDVASHEEAEPQGPYSSAVSVPIGDHGVFQAVAEPEGAFDESDLELAELLVSHAESALDRLEHERRLERQNDRLTKFASVVSHDLRNPLNVTRGRIELAQEEVDSEHLDHAATAVDRSLSLVERLLTLAREGEYGGDLEDVALADLVESCWATVETADATLHVECDRTIRAHPGQLKQLLENLFGNCVEHGSTNPQMESEDCVEHGSTDSRTQSGNAVERGDDVTVTVRDHADGFSVADDGPGIPEGERERVFDAGYSTTADGTGFGLDIATEIVDAHDWTIRVTESEHGGARFEITGVETVD